jgi:hypothetical protein
MADLNETNPILSRSQSFNDAVDAISGQPKNRINVPFDQRFDEGVTGGRGGHRGLPILGFPRHWPRTRRPQRQWFGNLTMHQRPVFHRMKHIEPACIPGIQSVTLYSRSTEGPGREFLHCVHGCDCEAGWTGGVEKRAAAKRKDNSSGRGRIGQTGGPTHSPRAAEGINVVAA